MHLPPANQPAVTIGFAVRNGAASMDAALESLVRQTHQNLRIVISDNLSTDETPAICQKWAARDERITYIRQLENIGPIRNFHFLLEQATTPYFMWAAHDDDWSPEFIEANLEVLEAQPEVVCCVSDVELVDAPTVPVPLIPGTEPLMEDAHTNLIHYLREPGANSRIYGVHRTEVLRRSFRPTDTYWAFDWVIIARSLMHGKHARVPRPLMRRRCRGESSDAERNIPRYNPSWWGQRFPMLPFTWALLTDDKIPRTPAVCLALWRWNRTYLKNSIRNFRHRRLYPVLERLRLRPARRVSRTATSTTA